MAGLIDIGVTIGTLPSGPTHSILDVPGVGVGHSTIEYDEAPPPLGRGSARTGVTVIDPGGDCWASPVPAGVALINRWFLSGFARGPTLCLRLCRPLGLWGETGYSCNKVSL